MAAPTIVDHGTVAQQQRWLRPLYTCDEIWCQLFSEPGAGSDLASVRTTAAHDGEEWIVNGQKVWTTLGHRARWGLLLARTDAAKERHRGLTYFVCDMRQPGVEVRPLRQLTGDAEFNEVFLNDARVSDADRIGAVGDGWGVAMTTLMHERVSIGGVVQPRGTGPIASSVEAYDRSGRPPAMRQRLLQLWVATEAARLTNLRALRLRERGTPGPEGSVAKLLFAELAQRVYDFTLDLMGADGMLFDQGYAMTSPEESVMVGGEARYMFLRSRGNSIEGGTSEIMRNILGERVLGLPKEPSGSSTSIGS
jgi:alkylation response protein AidB-like acyl-CoA dehydrogenase